MTPFKKDVAKAKALLAEAGYPNGFEVTLDHFAQAPYADIAQAIQADLASIGVKVHVAGRRAQAGDHQDARAPAPACACWTWCPDYLDRQLQRPGVLCQSG